MDKVHVVKNTIQEYLNGNPFFGYLIIEKYIKNLANWIWTYKMLIV